MLGYFIALFRTINVLAFRYYKTPKKHQHAYFVQKKIVLLKREVYCTMFTQTALLLLINKRIFV
jgi:hypothetical protein